MSGQTADRWFVAHHEAGHAVAAFVFERRRGPVTIRPGRGYLDAANGELGVVDSEPDGSLVFDEEKVRAVVVELYAGAAAQLRAGDREEGVRGASGDDDQQAADLIEWGLGAALDEHEAELRAEAARLVEEHWSVIERIAAELLLRETLDAVEVEALLEGEPGTLERQRALRVAGVEEGS